MGKCSVFVCKYKESCLYGADCSNDVRCCKLDKCKICRLEKHCTLKEGKRN